MSTTKPAPTKKAATGGKTRTRKPASAKANPKPAEPQELILPEGVFFGKDGKLYRVISHDGFHTAVPYADSLKEDDKVSPETSYDGGLIPFSTRVNVKIAPKHTITLAGWTELKAFFKKVYDRDKSECQVTLYRSPDGKQILAYPHHQYAGTGMTANEIDGHEETLARKKALAEQGYHEFGTVHHHCSSTAYASQTDKDDEANKPGVHITLGYLDKDKLCIDIRARMIRPGKFEIVGGKNVCTQPAINRLFEKCPMSAWLDIPASIAKLPGLPKGKSRDELIEMVMLENVKDENFLIESWMENVSEKKSSAAGSGQQTGLVRNGSTGQGAGSSSPASGQKSTGASQPDPCGINGRPTKPHTGFGVSTRRPVLTEKDMKRIKSYKGIREALRIESHICDVTLADVWDYFFVQCGWNPFRAALTRWEDTVIAIFGVYENATFEEYYEAFQVYRLPKPSDEDMPDEKLLPASYKG